MKLPRPLPVRFLVGSCFFLNLLSWPALSQVAPSQRIGLPQDWSNKHLIFPQAANTNATAMTISNPRLLYSRIQQARAKQEPKDVRTVHGAPARITKTKKKLKPHRDWSISLGNAPPATRRIYPAKFSFDINATPDCANDFAVFPISVAPSASQANIAAFNNLYTGTNPAGFCPGAAPTPMWGYQVSSLPVTTSPVPSLDGTKVVFVMDGTPSVFAVLAWKQNDGTVSNPKIPNPATTPLNSGLGEVFLLPLTGGGDDTGSSPFVDFTNDTAYVGTDNGTLFRIDNVFCSTLACKANPVFPSLAGGNWPVSIGTALSSPVHDQTSDAVFVGGADGNVYGFTSAGAPLSHASIQIGSGAAFGGVRDGPIVDSFNGFLYAAAGGDGAVHGVIAQTDIQLTPSSKRAAIVGQGAVHDIHLSTLNDSYENQPTNTPGSPTEWFIYVAGSSTVAPNPPVLFRVGFDASRIMNTSADSQTVPLSLVRSEVSPLTNIANGGVDRLFVGVGTPGSVQNFNISTVPSAISTPFPAAGGTSGMIIDNVSTAAQASSIYFMTMQSDPGCGGHICAVKLTQSGLN